MHTHICRITFCATLLCVHLHLSNTMTLHTYMYVHVYFVCLPMLLSAAVLAFFLVLDLSVFSSFHSHNTALVVTSYGHVGSALPVEKM